MNSKNALFIEDTLMWPCLFVCSRKSWKTKWVSINDLHVAQECNRQFKVHSSNTVAEPIRPPALLRHHMLFETRAALLCQSLAWQRLWTYVQFQPRVPTSVFEVQYKPPCFILSVCSKHVCDKTASWCHWFSSTVTHGDLFPEYTPERTHCDGQPKPQSKPLINEQTNKS